MKYWEKLDEILHYQGFFYIPNIIYSEIIRQYYDNPLEGYFRVDKISELIGKKYY